MLWAAGCCLPARLRSAAQLGGSRPLPSSMGCPPSRAARRPALPRSEEEGEGHEDFDPQQLREHEEFTKVAGSQAGGPASAP